MTHYRLHIERYLLARASLLCFLLIPSMCVAADPVAQTLKRSSSSITFAVDSPSPSLKMNGSFANYTGTLNLHPASLTQSSVRLSLTMTSARLQPDQVLQAVFLQTALAHMRQPTASFESTKISPIRGNTYLVNGNYTWNGKIREASVPIELIRSSPSLTEIRLLMDGSLHDKDVPQDVGVLAQGAGNTRGWVKANLVFTR